MNTINEKLKELRKKNSFTQSEVAQKLQLTRPTYNAYEQNICEPNIDTLIKLADFYHTSIDYLVGHNTRHIIDTSGLSLDKIKVINKIINLNDSLILNVDGFIEGLTYAEQERQDIIDQIKKYRGENK